MSGRRSPEEAQRIAACAQDRVHCRECGAPPGEPCTRPGSGRTVHQGRYIAAAIVLRQEAGAARRTPEQEAVLARLPHISPEEIEACRTPAGGYSFTREWFIEHGLPYPVTAIGDLITRDERKQLLARLADLEAVDREMRRPGSLTPAPEPVPLHRACGTASPEGTVL